MTEPWMPAVADGAAHAQAVFFEPAPSARARQPSAESLRDEVLAGLRAVPRRIPPKYFYDDVGAELFEQITRLDAYYLTRTELSILRSRLPEIAAAVGPGACVVELGSGSGLKTVLLLRHLPEPACYVPVDISGNQLAQLARSLAQEFPSIDIQPVCADYMREWPLPAAAARAARTVAFFPGSTIGNLEPADAARLLARLRRLCGPDGRLLIGADLQKEHSMLERAYDDPQGVTAAFNLNLLRRIDRECGADFDLGAFRHHAFYDEARGRIEMRLVATRRTMVTVPGGSDRGPSRFVFLPGDYITTEYSHKYTLPSFRALAASGGWTPERVWTDERGWFSVWLLRATRGTA